MQKLLEPLQISIRDVAFQNLPTSTVSVEFGDIFPNNAKLLPIRYLKGLLDDHLENLQINAVIATDASVSEEKAGVGIFRHH